MKKFFIVIALVGVCALVLQGIEVNLSIDAEQQYDNLKVLIQNADVKGFKVAFDKVNLPIPYITRLLRLICNERKELVAMSIKTQTSKITEGIVEMIIGVLSGLWLASFVCSMTSDKTPKGMKRFADAGFNLTTLLRKKLPEKLSLPSFFNRSVVGGISSVLGIVAFCFTFNGLTEGYKNLKVGLNYKQYLQHKLTNLEIIAVYIAQKETQKMKQHLAELSNS